MKLHKCHLKGLDGWLTNQQPRQPKTFDMYSIYEL